MAPLLVANLAGARCCASVVERPGPLASAAVALGVDGRRGRGLRLVRAPRRARGREGRCAAPATSSSASLGTREPDRAPARGRPRRARRRSSGSDARAAPDFTHGARRARAPVARCVPAARRADPRRLLLRRVLQHSRRTLLEARRATTRACSCRSSRSEDSVLGGIDEAIAVAEGVLGPPRRRTASGSAAGTSSRCARCTRATRSRPRETVMTIEGDYSLFAHLETVYLGSLARRTLIMRNVHEVVEAARGKHDLLLPRPPRPLARADRRRLGRARRRGDRRVDRRAGVVVGRARDRDRAARADRRLRRRHRRSPRASSPTATPAR